MSTRDEGLPDEAFTELEREAGVPSIMEGSGCLRYNLHRTELASEKDCVSLVFRSLVMSDVHDLIVVDNHGEGGELGVEYDVTAFRGVTLSEVGRCKFSILAYGRRITAPTLLNALRNVGLPFDFIGDWLVWDERSQSLQTDRHHQGDHLKLGFWWDGLDHEPRLPVDPERARVFKLLRTAYLSSDHGKKPILLHNSHLKRALEKGVVPFEEPRLLLREQAEDFSLVYFTSAGEVTSVPLSMAWEERVTVSTRAASFFHTRSCRSIRPSLSEAFLWANSFPISINNSPREFRYYLRRKRGSVFQSAFERVDLPEGVRFWDTSVEDVDKKARLISAWAEERNATVYITVDGHPLQSNYCTSTTADHYARAVRKWFDYGFEIRNSDGKWLLCSRVNVQVLAANREDTDDHPWKPAGVCGREAGCCSCPWFRQDSPGLNAP